MRKAARALRAGLAVLAGLIVGASFLWVALRPLRAAAIDALLARGWFPAARPWLLEIQATSPRVRAAQTILTLVHWGDDTEDKIVADLVAAFQARHPEIRVQRINPGNPPDVTRKVQTMAAAGDAPDVFQMNFDRVAGWAARGLLEPLAPFIAHDAQAADPDALRLADLYPNVADCFRYDADERVTGKGVLYGLPKDFTTVGFYYNKDLFRRAGLAEPPAEGWTWDEFLRACREIGKLPNCFGADFVTWEAMLRIYLWTLDADITRDGFKTYDFSDPRVVAALERLKGWFDEGRTLASAKTQIETSADPFLSGRVGLAGPFGRWKVPVYRLIEDFDWDFAPLPHAAGRPPANGVFTSGLGMSSASRHKDAAWKLMRFLLGPQGQRLISVSGLAIPARVSVAQSDAFIDPQKPGNDRVYLDMVQHARPITWPGDLQYQDAFRIEVEEIFKSGSKTVARGMADAQRAWREFDAAGLSQAEYAPMPWRPIALTALSAAAFVALLKAFFWWRGRPGRAALREELAGMGLVSPWLIGFFAFTAFPVALSLLLSLSDWSGIETLEHAGLAGWDNYRRLLRDERFLTSLRVTAWYAALAVPLGQVAALLAALLMNANVRGIYFFRAAWYLPSVLAGVAISILWANVFHHEHGLLNALLAPLADALNAAGNAVGQFAARRGLLPPEWLAGPWNLAPPRWFERDAYSWGVPAFVIMSLWAIGGPMMIYLAGLKGIPQDLYEAAHIDGARTLGRLRNVTLPMLSPVIFFNVIMAIIGSFQVFTQAYVMTGGGPGDATNFYVVHLFKQAFDVYQMGYASAMAWLLMLIILALTLAVMGGSRRLVYYEALR